MAVEFSQEVFDEICAEIADGKSLRKICKRDDMPSQVSVFRWLAADDELSKQYAHAREAQADALFDDCLYIADTFNSKEVLEPEHIQRAKLRIDTRKWMAGKLRPKKYGDKVQNEVSGPDGSDIPVSIKIGFKSPD